MLNFILGKSRLNFSFCSNVLNLIKNKETIRLLEKRNITSLFPIQEQTYQLVLEGRDIIARDRTGSGKTLSYALPLTEKLRNQNLFKMQKKQTPLLLVLVPTRELAIQVNAEFQNLNQNDYRTLPIYGGAPYEKQLEQLNQGAEIIIGTPGRLIDLLEREAIDFQNLQAIVLDEADQMLDMGFQKDIEQIYSFVSEKTKVQNMMFSATLPEWIHKISRKFTSEDRIVIDLVKNDQNKNQTSLQVEHLAIQCPPHQIISVLENIIQVHCEHNSKCIIFCDSKQEADRIQINAGIKLETAVLHGDIAQAQREIILQGLRDDKVRCLIATNVAARGLDLPQIDLIIQISPPKDFDSYIHRSGRTARAGRTGKSITIYNRHQVDLIQNIEQKTHIKFKKIGVPQPSDVINAFLENTQNQFQNIDSSMLINFKPKAQELISKHGAEEAISRALAIISGYTRQASIKQRSMMSGQLDLITYQTSGIQDSYQLFKFVTAQLGKDMVNGIKNINRFEGTLFFDIDKSQATIYENLSERMNKSKNRENISKVDQLPDNFQGEQYQNQNVYGLKDQNRDRGYNSYNNNRQQGGQQEDFQRREYRQNRDQGQYDQNNKFQKRTNFRENNYQKQY